MHPRQLWWCLPAIVLCGTDGLLTLCGQPEAYWSGNFASINEGHPVPAWFLSLHPWRLPVPACRIWFWSLLWFFGYPGVGRCSLPSQWLRDMPSR